MQTIAITPVLGAVTVAICAAMIGSLYAMEAVGKAARRFREILRNRG